MKRPKAEVTVSTVVAVDPEVAFEVFTDDIDRWWQRGPRFRFSLKRGVLRFDRSGADSLGRLVEVYDEGANDLWEVGRVLSWEPGALLSFEWRLPNFAEHERTEVDVTFEPVDGGTRVTIEHRGLTALPPEHPARHGAQGHAFTDRTGLWWGQVLMSMRAFATRAATPGSDGSP